MGTRKIVQCVGHVPTWILSPTTHMIHRASQELVLKPQKSVTMNNASVTQKKKKKGKIQDKTKRFNGKYMEKVHLLYSRHDVGCMYYIINCVD